MGARVDIDEVSAALKSAEERVEQLSRDLIAIKQQVVQAEQEVSDYEITLRMMRRLVPVDNTTNLEAEDEGLQRGGVRKAVEEAIHTFARDGKTAGEIREYISHRFHLDVPPNTISVTLNRLKAANLAKLNGQRWSPDDGRDRQGLANAPPGGYDLNDEIPF